MLRAMVCVSTLLMLAASVTACDTQTGGQNHSPASTAAIPAPLNQSSTFFPTNLVSYGLNLSPTDRDRLAELRALRQIDPCGFVDQKTLIANGHKDFSYTYTAVPWIESGGNSPSAPLGGDGCMIAFPAKKTGLALQVLPGEARWNDGQFSPDPVHDGVTRQAPYACTFRVALPLTHLAGAPTSMRDPLIEVSPRNIDDDPPSVNDTSLCQSSEAVANSIAAHVKDTGIPTYSADASGAAKFLTADPCAAATDLHAAGLVWKEPSPTAQWPTTWRHPGVCNLQLAATEPDPGTAVVKYGLVNWSDTVLDMPWGETPERSDRDGVALFSFNTYLAPGCLVIAKPNTHIDPVTVGAGAPDLTTPTPIVTVRLSTPVGTSCAETAAQAALDAVKRAI